MTDQLRSRSDWLVSYETTAELIPDEVCQALAAVRVDAGQQRLGVVCAGGAVVIGRADFEANFGPLPAEGNDNA